MGTSADHPGGSGTAWNKARASGREWANQGGGSGPGLVRLVANAAAALAGGYEGTAATNAAAPGVSRIGGLASGPPDQTLNDALRRNGLDDLIGRPLAEVHAALVNFIAGDPEGRDADLVRQAADEAVAELLETSDDLDALVVDVAAGERMMLRFLTEWLTRLITRELSTALLDANARAHEARSAEIREYIAERLAALTERTPIADIDWNSADGNTEARRILNGAREVFEE